MSYSNFARSEPDQARERCVAFHKHIDKWIDIGCNLRVTAVCEATLVSICISNAGVPAAFQGAGLVQHRFTP